MAMNFCPSCGAEVGHGEHFCPGCGHALDTPTDATTADPAQVDPPKGPPPPEAPAGPPPAATGPPVVAPPTPAGARTGATTKAWIIAAVFIVVALVATALVVSRTSSPAAGEVFLAPADQPGPDPYTSSVAKAAPSTTSSTTTAPPTTTAPRQVPAHSGAAPGLYGGTGNVASCDATQLVGFLAANPAKAQAWVAALNADPTLRWSGGTSLSTTQIGAYVNELTSVVLTADTRVTNHGYRNGAPTTLQAVLQAGTAVMIDRYGVPRVKCGCGNPLTAPRAVSGTPRYTGTRWPGFTPTTVIVVQPSVTVITQVVLVNLSGPGYIERPVGTNGAQDTPVATLPSTVPPSTATTEPPASTATTAPTSSSSGTGAGFCADAPAWLAAFKSVVLTLLADQTPSTGDLIAKTDVLLSESPSAAVTTDLQAIRTWLEHPSPTGSSYQADAFKAYLIDTCHLTVDL